MTAGGPEPALDRLPSRAFSGRFSRVSGVFSPERHRQPLRSPSAPPGRAAVVSPRPWWTLGEATAAPRAPRTRVSDAQPRARGARPGFGGARGPGFGGAHGRGSARARSGSSTAGPARRRALSPSRRTCPVHGRTVPAGTRGSRSFLSGFFLNTASAHTSSNPPTASVAPSETHLLIGHGPPRPARSRLQPGLQPPADEPGPSRPGRVLLTRHLLGDTGTGPGGHTCIAFGWINPRRGPRTSRRPARFINVNCFNLTHISWGWCIFHMRN